MDGKPALAVGADGRLHMSGIIGDGGELKRNFDFEAGTVEHESLILPNDRQAAGLGKQLLASQVSTYKKMGLKAVNLTANINVGAYAWAKYGFVPDQKSWDRVRSAIKAKLDNMNPDEWGLKGDVADIHAALASENPQAIWAVVDSKATLLNENDEEVPIAKHFLTGKNAPDWDGSLRLDDATALKRFDSYVTPKK